MLTRRRFLNNSFNIAAGSLLIPSFLSCNNRNDNMGVQLYTFRKEMLADPKGTLQKIASLGIKQIESAGSEKGYYYGLTPKEMKQICTDLGMTLRSGHVHIGDKWNQTMDDAVASGQEYLICSTMPSEGQTIDNYKKTADIFNKAGQECNQRGIKFGYHNHDYEFETQNGQVLYDVLLNNTQQDAVHMELDLGWVIVAGKNPLDYFNNFPGRFPLWHLKDMNVKEKHSVEFGKGQLAIKEMLANKQKSGLQYIFIEQEEYASTPMESIQYNMDYLKKI